MYRKKEVKGLVTKLNGSKQQNVWVEKRETRNGVKPRTEKQPPVSSPKLEKTSIEYKEADVEEDMNEPCAAMPRSSLAHRRLGEAQIGLCTNPLQTLSKLSSLFIKIRSERQLAHKARPKTREAYGENQKKYDQKFNYLMEELRKAYEHIKIPLS